MSYHKITIMRNNEQKRLLIFHACLPTYRIDLFNRLSKDFQAVAILFGRPSLLRSLAFNLKAVEAQAEIAYEWQNEGLFLGNHLISSMYYRKIKEFKPDIVWCQELGINTLAAILLKRFFKYKIVLNVDDSPSMLIQYSKSRRLLRKFVYRHVDEICVVHRKVKEELGMIFPTNKFFYLPIIQSDRTFSVKIENSLEKAMEYEEQYNLKDKVVFLFVGRLEDVKQPMMLLEAFCQADIPNSILFFVGEGGLHREMQNYIMEKNLQDSVILTGRKTGDSLFAWYRLADYFVLPSKFEPFGAVVNEALLVGCRVIVSDKVGASTLVDDHNGVVVPYDDNSRLVMEMERHYKMGKKKNLKSLMNISFNELYSQLRNELNNI